MVDTSPKSDNEALEGTPAYRNRELLGDAAVFAIHLNGTPGCGKTLLIESTIRRLGPGSHVGVIIANPVPTHDVSVCENVGAQAFALQTPMLDAESFQQAVNSLMISPRRMDLLLIESPGRLLDTPQSDLGQSARVAVFSVTGGDNKAAQFPNSVRDADLVVLTKIDLLPHVRFDVKAFRNDVHRLNPTAKIIELSATEGAGMDEWLDWLLASSLRAKTRHVSAAAAASSEWWFG